MKEKQFQIVPSGGHDFGQVLSAEALMGVQQYAHDHAAEITHDFGNSTRDYETAGFSYAIGSGNSFQITVKKPGRVYLKDGTSFGLYADTMVTIAAPDPELPRVDLIIAKLEDESPQVSDLIPFTRLRTPDEFAADPPVGPYSPTNLQQATELHWRAVIQVKQGTPASTPVTPSYDSNEIPLYVVSVAANAGSLRPENISDQRVPLATVRDLNDYRATDRTDINRLITRVTTLEGGASDPHDLTTQFGALIAELKRQIAASGDVPEIRYDRPKYVLTDKRTSQILATGGTTSSVPHVDIAIGGRVNFGDADVTILPQNFADQSLLPRYATVGSPSGHTRRDVDITLGGVTQLSSDGSTSFAQKGAHLPSTSRYLHAQAARNGQYVEIFGGANGAGGILSDWLTYDTVGDTLTPRVPTGVNPLPASGAPAMFPYGDGVHVLLICGNSDSSIGSQNPRCFKLNCSTSAVTEITTTKPTGCWFTGDLVSDGKIVISATKHAIADDAAIANGASADLWRFDTSDDTFHLLAPTGTIPMPRQWMSGGCYYAEGKLVLFVGSADGSMNVNPPATTYIFDLPTVQWTEINIDQPYSEQGGFRYYYRPFFKMANINGRPTVIGDAGGVAPQYAWELVTSPSGLQWRRYQISIGLAGRGGVMYAGVCSTIGTSGRANGGGMISGGIQNSQTYGQTTINLIYLSTQAGLIAADYAGATGVSVGEGSSVVQFEVPLYTEGFQVAAYQADIVGSNLADLLVELSLDNGAHWHTIELGRTFTVTDSANPGARRLRVTMYRSGSTAPILTKLTEILDGTGGILEDRQVIRFNTPTSGDPKALYIDRAGVVTFESTIVPSVATKAIILQVTPNGTSAPLVKSFFNRRRPILKYSGTHSVSLDIAFDNEMAVDVRFSRQYGIVASTKHLYDWGGGGFTFGDLFAASGDPVAVGDVWVIELYG